MEVELIRNESKEAILEFSEADLTIPELLASRLLQQDDIEFAGIAQNHPETGRPRLVVKTEKHKAVDALCRAIEDIDGDLNELKTELSRKK